LERAAEFDLFDDGSGEARDVAVIESPVARSTNVFVDPAP